ncbi:hypothetical protein D3C74_442230 [compost metagenome]
MRMNFRQQLDVERIRQRFDLVEKLVDVRLHEETAGSQLFNDISNRIQSNNLDVLLLEILKEGA